jgi:lipoyl-dependent peroxiredoxin
MKRTGSAVWNGDLKSGKGSISTESGALDAKPYSFTSRFEDGAGTNPEELIGAAHAGCFSMALSNELSGKGVTADSIETSSAIEVRPAPGGGFTITTAHLTVKVTAPGADEAAVRAAAEGAEKNCPVSKVLNAEISMDLTVVN